MTFEDCLEFTREVPVGFLATADGEEPHVRPMTVWLADRSGFYFYTSTVKPLMSQLRANPRVEIAFHKPGALADGDTVLRIAGRIEMVRDREIRKRLYEAFPWLKEIGTGTPDTPTIAVFRIPRGRFNFWRWENNVHPGPWIEFP